jgi:hypothetical protein
MLGMYRLSFHNRLSCRRIVVIAKVTNSFSYLHYKKTETEHVTRDLILLTAFSNINMYPNNFDVNPDPIRSQRSKLHFIDRVWEAPKCANPNVKPIRAPFGPSSSPYIGEACSVLCSSLGSSYDLQIMLYIEMPRCAHAARIETHVPS